MGDAFYRWDGFSYYASFSEFLPAVALTSILWSIVAVFVTVLVWLSFSILLRAFRVFELKIKSDHLLLCTGVFMLLGTLAWKGKKILWPYVLTTLQVKLIVFVFAAVLSALLTWLFRNRAEKIIDIIRERITPLIWLFGLFIIFSVPLVVYQTWWKQTTEIESMKNAPPPVTDGNRPNIILLTFDALAARNMSLYGYTRETTPFINEWAKDAAVFTKAEAESNFTTSATASLMTGKRVWTHQVYHLEGSSPVRSEVESLPAVLKENGYYNMAFVVNPHTSVQVLGMSNSFDIAPPASEFSMSQSILGWKFGFIDVALYEVFGDKIRLHNWIFQRDFILNRLFGLISRNFNKTEVPVEKTFDRFMEIIDYAPPEPYFAWIHIFPPHDPYLPPESYRNFFNTSSEFRTYKSQEAVRLETFKYLFQYQPFPQEMQPTIDLLRSHYDEFIRYCDEEFGNFIKQLEKSGKLNNTVVILSADHGESFEHSYFTHGGAYLYEQVTNIPLIIKEPGYLDGRVVRDLVEQIDIPATILDLVNIPVPSWMEGRSLLPALRGREVPPRQAFSMVLEENPSRGHQINRGTFAVWEGDYKLIHYLERDESLLFNLKDDSGELVNLFDREVEKGKRLLDLIRENLKIANKKIGDSK